MAVSAPHGRSAPVPRIDVGPILDGELDSLRSRGVQAQLRAACSDIGFMTITGHGIPRERIDAVVAAASHFFALPGASKLAVAPRRWNADSPNVYRGYFPSSVAGKEGLDIGEPSLEDDGLLQRPYHERNQVADVVGLEGWGAIEAYFDASSRLATAILRALVASLGGEADQVDEAFARPASLSTLRFNFYPARERPVAVSEEDDAQLCCEAHVDSGLLTLLHQDDRGGLQVQGTDQCWYSIEPDADAFVVNTGLALQRMTGRELVATRHRVLHETHPRLSIPFFFEPVPDFVMSPDSFALPFAPARTRQDYESFLRESLAKFSEYQR